MNFRGLTQRAFEFLLVHLRTAWNGLALCLPIVPPDKAPCESFPGQLIPRSDPSQYRLVVRAPSSASDFPDFFPRSRIWVAFVFSLGFSSRSGRSRGQGHRPCSNRDRKRLGQSWFASFSGLIGNFNVVVTQGIGYPAIGSPAQPILDLTSVNLTTAAGGGTLTVMITETGFTTTPAAQFSSAA